MSLIGKGILNRKCGLGMSCYWQHFSCKASKDIIQKSVFISQSKDIYTNLALEDWFYKNYDFKNQHALLLWRSDPCVVIGRHQNPWIESNIQALEKDRITLARRNSGGGTVYHDPGNLNLSFFTPRERYNREYNLNIITRALYREWGLNAMINKREDIVVQGDYKVSGTAAKLGRPNAYHHCTLLVDVQKGDLRTALEKKEKGIVTNATESVRSPVKNLAEVNPHIRIDQLMNAIGWEYLRTKALSLDDGGYKLVQEQKGFQMLNPSEDWFPGITKLKDDFCSWDWIYGKTPKFTLTRTLEFPKKQGKFNGLLKLTLEVDSGIIVDIKMTLPPDIEPKSVNRDASVITSLRGTRYSPGVTNDIVAATGCKVVSVDDFSKINESDVAATL